MHIEASKPGDRGRREPSQGSATEVGIGLVPDIAHRREAIIEMGNALRNPDALRERVTCREDEVIAFEVELSNGEGKEGEKFTVVPGLAGEAIKDARDDSAVFDRRGNASRGMDKGEEVRVGVTPGKVVQHALAAAIANQPVVYERDLQVFDASSPDPVCGPVRRPWPGDRVGIAKRTSTRQMSARFSWLSDLCRV